MYWTNKCDTIEFQRIRSAKLYWCWFHWSQVFLWYVQWEKFWSKDYRGARWCSGSHSCLNTAVVQVGVRVMQRECSFYIFSLSQGNMSLLVIHICRWVSIWVYVYTLMSLCDFPVINWWTGCRYSFTQSPCWYLIEMDGTSWHSKLRNQFHSRG